MYRSTYKSSGPVKCDCCICKAKRESERQGARHRLKLMGWSFLGGLFVAIMFITGCPTKVRAQPSFPTSTPTKVYAPVVVRKGATVQMTGAMASFLAANRVNYILCDAQAGCVVIFQVTTNLNPPHWKDLAYVLVNTNGQVIYTNKLGNATNQFYRAFAVQPPTNWPGWNSLPTTLPH